MHWVHVCHYYCASKNTHVNSSNGCLLVWLWYLCLVYKYHRYVYVFFWHQSVCCCKLISMMFSLSLTHLPIHSHIFYFIISQKSFWIILLSFNLFIANNDNVMSRIFVFIKFSWGNSVALSNVYILICQLMYVIWRGSMCTIWCINFILPA